MADLSGQNIDGVQPNSYEPLPAGEYLAAIVESDWRETKDRSGRYLYLVLEVLEGEQQGRRVFERVNLENRNPQAVDIARKTLAGICQALGMALPPDSAAFHDRPLRVKVGIDPGRDGYGPSNKIKGYLPADGAAPAPSAPAPAGPKLPPWGKK